MQKECHSRVPRGYETDDRASRRGILLSTDVFARSASRAVLEDQCTTTSRASPLDLCPATPLSLKVRWLFHSEGVEDHCWYGGCDNLCRSSSRSVCSSSPHDRRPRCAGLARGMPARQRWYGNCGNDIRRQARPCAKDTPHRDRSGSGARGAEHHTLPCGDVNALKGAAQPGGLWCGNHVSETFIESKE